MGCFVLTAAPFAGFVDVEPGQFDDSAPRAQAGAQAAQRAVRGFPPHEDGGSGASDGVLGQSGESGGSDATADSLVERLTHAMSQLLDPRAGDGGVKGSLFQVWVPQPADEAHGTPGGVLATRGQPFTVSPASTNCDALAAFRFASTHYAFSPRASNFPVGMPGRVYNSGRAELSPNVQLYDREQYVRLPDAVQCGIKGTLAVPVFDEAASGPARRRPAAVIEVATSRADVDWGAMIDRISGACSSARLSTSSSAARSGGSMPSIVAPLSARCGAVLTTLVARAATAQGMAYAQAWRLAEENGAAAGEAGLPPPACLHAAGLPHCCAPGVAASAELSAFRAMCADTPLCEGQGLPGVALLRGAAEWHGPGGAFDITAYPLCHFATAAGLRSGCALRLAVPPADGGGIVVVECLSSQVAAGGVEAEALLATYSALLAALSAEAEAAGLMPSAPATRKRGAVPPGAKPAAGSPGAPAAPQPDDEIEGDEDGDDEEGEDGEDALPGSATVRRSLPRDVVTDHFQFGLTEAAKRLGMCPTTLKRICRRYGVARWPSRRKYRDEILPLVLGGGGVEAVMELMTGVASNKRPSLDAPRQNAAAAAPASGSGRRRGSSSTERPEDAAQQAARMPASSSDPSEEPQLLDNPRCEDNGSGHGQLRFTAAVAFPVPPAPSAGALPQAGLPAAPQFGASPPSLWPNVSLAFSPGSGSGSPQGVGAGAPSAAASRFCHACGAPLKRPGAAFCHLCGINQD